MPEVSDVADVYIYRGPNNTVLYEGSNRDLAEALAMSGYGSASNGPLPPYVQTGAPAQTTAPTQTRALPAYSQSVPSREGTLVARQRTGNNISMPGSREAQSATGVAPVVTHRNPFTTVSSSVEQFPWGNVVTPLVGYPSQYPHVINGAMPHPASVVGPWLELVRPPAFERREVGKKSGGGGGGGGGGAGTTRTRTTAGRQQTQRGNVAPSIRMRMTPDYRNPDVSAGVQIQRPVNIPGANAPNAALLLEGDPTRDPLPSTATANAAREVAAARRNAQTGNLSDAIIRSAVERADLTNPDGYTANRLTRPFEEVPIPFADNGTETDVMGGVGLASQSSAAPGPNQTTWPAVSPSMTPSTASPEFQQSVDPLLLADQYAGINPTVTPTELTPNQKAQVQGVLGYVPEAGSYSRRSLYYGPSLEEALRPYR